MENPAKIHRTKSNYLPHFWALLLSIAMLMDNGNSLAASQSSGNDALCSPAAMAAWSSRNETVTFSLARKLSLQSQASGMAWSADSKLIATTEGLNWTIEIWEAETGKLINTIHKQPGGGIGILFTPDGKNVITPSLDSLQIAFVLIDIHTGQAIRSVNGPNDTSHFAAANEPKDFVLSPDGKNLYVSFNLPDKNIHIYSTSTWTEIGTIPDLAFIMSGGPADNELTTVGPLCDLRIWDVSSATIVRNFDLAQPDPTKPRSFNIATSCSAIASAPAACLLAFGTMSGGRKLNMKTNEIESGFDTTPVRLWSLNAGKQLSAWPANTQQIRALAFSPDARVLAAAADIDRSVVVFLTHNLSAAKTLFQFRGSVSAVAFSPDGRYLAAAGDSKIVLYNVQ